MADDDPTTYLQGALDAGPSAIARWLEQRAVSRAEKLVRDSERNAGFPAGAAIAASIHDEVTDLLSVAATYRLVVAQEQTAYLLQRLVDAAERDK